MGGKHGHLGAKFGHLGATHGHLGAADPEVNLIGKSSGALGKASGVLGKEDGALGAADPRKNWLGAWRTNGARAGEEHCLWRRANFGERDCIPQRYDSCSKCGAPKGTCSHPQPERRR